MAHLTKLGNCFCPLSPNSHTPSSDACRDSWAYKKSERYSGGIFFQRPRIQFVRIKLPRKCHNLSDPIGVYLFFSIGFSPALTVAWMVR
jgi:hypothetical protein